MRRYSFYYSLSFVCFVLLSGCESRYPKVDPGTGIPILVSSLPGGNGFAIDKQALMVGPELEPATNCEEVAELFRLERIESVTQSIQAQFESAWRMRERCDDPCGIYGCFRDMSLGYADAGAAMPLPEPTEDTEDPDHSETNNQVAGVDEADMVKTDGNFIYLLSGRSFRIFKSWPAAETAPLVEIPFQGTPTKLFVHNDRALIYTSQDQGASFSNFYGNGECTYGYDCVPTGDGYPTQISVFDISDRSAPVLVRRIELSSSLLAARRIGNIVHTVVTKSIGRFDFTNMDYYPDGLNDLCEVSNWKIYSAFVELLDKNIQQIMNTPLSVIFPTLTDQVISATGETQNPSPMESCQGLYQASINDGHQFTSVVSLDISQESAASAVSILSQPGVIYASRDSLYMAVPRLRLDGGNWYADLEVETEATTIQKFKLESAQARASYVASGLIKGRILNQFALDEYEQHLRIASTSGRFSQMENTVTILQQQGPLLISTGILEKLAPTEDIRSVRFDGDKGYVVTFKTTDPLFVIDLQDPTQPSVLGELKIPGFSTYMQKMDDHHLLTIGYDGDDQGGFAWFTGVMLQIFDVSDPTSPQLKFKHVISTRGSSSEALTNHLAFTYYAPKNVLALPITVCEDSQGGGSYGMNMTFSGLMVFDVTAEAGFSLRGQVTFPVAGAEQEPDPWSYDYNDMCTNWWTQASSEVKRSLIIDNFVYSISPSTLKVNNLDDLGSDLVSLPLN